MSKFELLKHETVSAFEIVEHTYIIQDDKGKIIYKEWVNDSGEVIDSTLQDKDESTIYDFGLYDQVVEFIDIIKNINNMRENLINEVIEVQERINRMIETYGQCDLETAEHLDNLINMLTGDESNEVLKRTPF